MHQLKLIVVLFTFHLVYISSEPSCRFTGSHGTTFICKPGSSDYSLKRGLVSDNNKTTVLILRSCRITDVDYESFMGLPRTHTIELSLNKLKTLKLGVLDESNAVKKFNISFNEIVDIPLGLFDMMPNLEVLDARGNNLKKIDLGIFDPLKKLYHLDISSNKLKGSDMSPYLLDQTKKLTFLDYSRNDMSDAPENLLNSLEVLDFLNLDRCRLTKIPEFPIAGNLGSLRHLVVSNNMIVEISGRDTFGNTYNLEILDMSGNKVNSIHPTIFQPLRKIKSLFLSFNLLQNLPSNIFDNLIHLNHLDLSHNRLTNIPDGLFHNLPKLKKLNLSLNRLAYLPEEFCKKLLASGTSVSKLYFNDNPFQCACLRDILLEVKKYGLVYNKNRYTGTKVVCAEPDGWQFSCRRNLQGISLVYSAFDAKDGIKA